MLVKAEQEGENNLWCTLRLHKRVCESCEYISKGENPHLISGESKVVGGRSDKLSMIARFFFLGNFMTFYAFRCLPNFIDDAII